MGRGGPKSYGKAHKSYVMSMFLHPWEMKMIPVHIYSQILFCQCSNIWRLLFSGEACQRVQCFQTFTFVFPLISPKHPDYQKKGLFLIQLIIDIYLIWKTKHLKLHNIPTMMAARINNFWHKWFSHGQSSTVIWAEDGFRFFF